MSVYLDSFYKIGSTHETCEDYALTGAYRGMSYAIVCDGCSSFDGVDVGARILAFIARGALHSFYDSGHFTDANYATMKDTISDIKAFLLKEMDEIYKRLSSSKDILSTTLLIAVHIEGGISFFLGWGDGYFIEKDVTDTVIHKVEFETNAPFYLNYLLTDPDTMATEEINYFIHSKGKKAVATEYLSTLGSDIEVVREERSQPTNYHFFKMVDCSKGPKHLIVGSDGLGSFSTGENRKLTPYRRDIDSIMDIIAYRKSKNNFSEKAFERYLDSIKEDKAHHYDDVSTATIMVGGLIKNHKKK